MRKKYSIFLVFWGALLIAGVVSDYSFAATKNVSSRTTGQKTTRAATTRRTVNTTRGIKARTAKTDQIKSSFESKGSLIKLHVDEGLYNKYGNLKKYVSLSGSQGYISLLKIGNKLPDLTSLFTNTQRSTGVTLSGAYDKLESGTLVFDASGVPATTTPTASDLYLRVSEKPAIEPENPAVPSCPEWTASVSFYQKANTSVEPIRMLTGENTGGTLNVATDCGWLFRDTDALCRQGTYSYNPSGTTYYDWNGVIVNCDKTDLHTDYVFGDLDLGPIGNTVPSNFYENKLLDVRHRIAYEYNKVLPTLVPYINAAKNGMVSGLYTFRGGYVGDSCSVTYNNGTPTIGSGCQRIYNNDGSPAKVLTSSDSKKLTFAWDYSGVTASSCPNKKLTTNTDSMVACTVQRSIVSTTDTVVNPTEECAVLCKDALGVCYVEGFVLTDGEKQGVATGMVPCDITGYVNTNNVVRILDDGRDGDAVNTVRYKTFMKNYAIRYGWHTKIYVQNLNTWPSLSNLVSDLYHSENGTSSDGKVLSGIYTRAGCTGDKVYDKTGAFVGKTYTNASELPEYIYMCWQEPAQDGPATVENTCSDSLSDYPATKAGDTFIKRVQTTNQSTLSGAEDCAAIVRDSIGQCYALKQGANYRALIPCDTEKNYYSLGYSMAKVNRTEFLPWTFDYPVTIKNSDGEKVISGTEITVKNATGTSYMRDDDANAGMLQLPDLTNYVKNLTPPAGKSFVGIYSMWGKDITATYHLDGTAGGDFTFTSQKLYDETGKPVNKYVSVEDLPWTYPTLANTGGRPYYMFIIFEDAVASADECPDVTESPTNAYSDYGFYSSDDVPTGVPRTVMGRNSNKKSDCGIIIKYKSGFCRLAKWNGNEYGEVYFTGKNSNGEEQVWGFAPIVDCSKADSYLDAAITLEVENTVYQYANMAVGIEYGKPLPSLEPMIAMEQRMSPKSTFEGGSSHGKQYWDTNGKWISGAYVTKISGVWGDSDFDVTAFTGKPSARVRWDRKSVGVDDCPVPSVIDAEIVFSTGGTFVTEWDNKIKRKISMYGDDYTDGFSIMRDCAYLLQDSDGLCYLKSASSLIKWGLIDCDVSDDDFRAAATTNVTDWYTLPSVLYSRNARLGYSCKSDGQSDGSIALTFTKQKPTDTQQSLPSLVKIIKTMQDQGEGCAEKTFKGIWGTNHCKETLDEVQYYDESGEPIMNNMPETSKCLPRFMSMHWE